MESELALTIPARVRDAYALLGAEIEPVTIGLINRTYHVKRRGAPAIALQRLHSIFAAEVNLDLDAVTRHLEASGMETPRLVFTKTGEAFVDDGGVWRALTWLEGKVITELGSTALAEEAGFLAGRFHRATTTLRHEFHFARAGVHDTLRHLSRLEDALVRHAGAPAFAEVRPVAAAILGHARTLDVGVLARGPMRIVHGDLKISNVLFDPSGTKARALLDLDTLARATLATDLGDALRSWCNPRGESDPAAVVDEGLFAAALDGYARAAAGSCEDVEIASLLPATELIATELASRFCADALEDRYFGWDKTRFPSRVAHNLVRARSQLSLARSLGREGHSLEAAVRSAFGR